MPCSKAWGQRQISSTLPLPEGQQERGQQGSDLPGRHGRQQAKAEGCRQARAQGGPCYPGGQLLRSSRESTVKNRREHLLLPPLLWTSFSRRAPCGGDRAKPVATSGEAGVSSPPSVSHFPIALLPVQVANNIQVLLYLVCILCARPFIEKGFDISRMKGVC